jgi:Domain of unknown function (DUF4262)
LHEKIFRKVWHDIEEYGWSCIGVFRSEEDPEGFEPFSYSVGFFLHNEHPELIVVGLPNETAHSILWTLYNRISAGERFQAGDSISGVIQGFDVRLRAMPADGRPLNVARSYFELDELPALQVIWPDEDGRFPGEEGCNENYERMQDIEPISV